MSSQPRLAILHTVPVTISSLSALCIRLLPGVKVGSKVIIGAGAVVGPTPDGRKAGQPTADSVAAVNGKAVKGPTVMLQGAACYEQKDTYGMAVTNLSLTKKCTPEVLRALVEGYFSLGGTQLQVTVADRQKLLDAHADPDAHRDLIVRVGGYAEYFCRLSKELQRTVIERTAY